jgi:hypothetical protein
MIADQSN